MNPKATLGLLLVTLGGVLVGAWLAAEVGLRRDRVGASEQARAADSVAPGEPRFSAELACPGAETPRVSPAARPDPADPRWIPSETEATFAVLVRADGVGAARGARVAVFAWGDERPVFPALDWKPAATSGLAYVRAKHHGAVVVMACAPGFMPAMRFVDAVPGQALELNTIELERGATIQGRVEAGGEPLARADVQARLDAPGDAANLEDVAIGWRNEHFVWSIAHTESGPDGSYVFRDLEPAAHTLRIAAIRRHDAAIDTLKGGAKRAVAPCEGVDFLLPAARLELEFMGPEMPLCCVEVQVEAGDRHFTRTTDAQGRLSIAISPAAAYPITAACGGYSTVRTELRGMADREHSTQRLRLEPRKVLSTVVVDDGGSAGNWEAAFTFRPRFRTTTDTGFMRSIRRDPSTRAFRIENVPSGSWHVTMRSGRRLPSLVNNRVETLLWSNCDVDFSVEVPDTGVVKVATRVSERGSLQITVTNAHQRRVEAKCELRSLDGLKIDSVVVSGRESNLEMAIQDSTLEMNWPTTLYPSLCSGAADLVVWREDSAPRTVRVVITPGSVLAVDVQLQPK